MSIFRSYQPNVCNSFLACLAGPVRETYESYLLLTDKSGLTAWSLEILASTIPVVLKHIAKEQQIHRIA